MSNYPAGAEHDPNAPWNQPEPDNYCMYCGDPTVNKHYCSRECRIADLND